MTQLPKHSALIATLCLSPFLVQCLATSQDFRALDLRLRTMNNKMISMDRNVSDLQTETAARAKISSLDDLQKNQADSINTLDYLKTQLLQVKGQMEENAHQVQKLQEESKFQQEGQSGRFHDLSEGVENLRTSLDELQGRLTALEKKAQTDSATLQQLSGEMEKIRTDRVGEAAEQARKAADDASRAAKAAEEARATAQAAEKTEPAEAAKTKAAEERASEPAGNSKSASKEKKPAGSDKKDDKKKTGKTPSGSETKESAAEAAQKLYEAGMANFTAKKFPKAYADFNRYLEEYPQGALAANARFWLGDSLYNQQEYELAILEYQKVISDYPKNGKSPAALLKQGMAFEQLKDRETAKLVFLKLTDEYKNSDEAAVAQKHLEALK